MKIIDKYLLKSFLITFATVFVILFFIFVLQSIWLFIAELAGKDLDFMTIFKFIFYYSPIMVPLVLPLSILLASIMTFGSFAENYEFAAMKSGGISLGRAMRYLIVCTVLFSGIAFLFANNIIPEAQFRFINLRKTIVQTKPAMAIGEGQFSKIGTTTSIYVEKKSGENGSFLEGVTMHMKKGEFGTVTTVIKAKKGVLKSDESTNLLQLDLLDGNYYEDIQPKKFEERDKLPFAKSSFKKYTVTIDLAKLNGASEEGAEIVNAYNMLNMSELKYTIDSLQTTFNKDVTAYSDNLDKSAESLAMVYNAPVSSSVIVPKKTKLTGDLIDLFPTDKKTLVIDVAKGVEEQTENLVRVCRMRKIPTMVFINKLDREGKDAFDLLDEVEQKLGLKVRPLSWPVGMGQSFQGVYNMYEQKLSLFRAHSKQFADETTIIEDLADSALEKIKNPIHASAGNSICSSGTRGA
ncbi:MAG: hypothetical protein RLZZ479_1480, partial [Bacteroidota bacterium]